MQLGATQEDLGFLAGVGPAVIADAALQAQLCIQRLLKT